MFASTSLNREDGVFQLLGLSVKEKVPGTAANKGYTSSFLEHEDPSLLIPLKKVYL